MKSIDKITKLVFEKLEESSDGLTWTDLYSFIKNEYPDIPHGTIVGCLRNFYNKNKGKTIYKPDKGIYKLLKYQDNQNVNDTNSQSDLQQASSNINENDFYESFSEWLVDVQDECTKAKKLGGNVFGGKWGTPDVIGVDKSIFNDFYQKKDIVSVEIKYSPNELITAFGQACSYKLFSHKVYLVIPKQSNLEEISRLDSLCFLFGIGLVLFDNSNPKLPDYQLKNRAQKGEPDIFYLNKYINKAREFFTDLFS